MEVRILHVEDDLSYQQLLVEKLRNLAVAVTGITTVEEAMKLIYGGSSVLNDELLQRLKKDPLYEIVVTDVHLADTVMDGPVWLPRKDGYLLAQSALNIGIPYVFIASATDTPSKKIEGTVMFNKIQGFSPVRQLAETLARK